MRKNDSRFTDLLALLVFGLFALCLLLVLLTGARVYRDVVSLGEESHLSSTGRQYLATRVRQEQEAALEDFGGCTALALREQIDGACYVTYIYCHDGWLRELYCAEGAGLSLEDGERVLEAESLALSLEGGLLTADIDGERIYLSLRAGKAVEP